MINNVEDLNRLSNEQFRDLLASNGRVSQTGVSGFYIESGSGIGVVGWEGLTFVGIDNVTGKRVTASYAGATIGPSADLFGFSVGAGIFEFSGTPDSLGGWSFGAQIYSGVSAGVSVNIEDSGTLILYGGQLSVGGNVALGETYRVRVDGELIYGIRPGPNVVVNPNTYLTPDEFAAESLSTENVNFDSLQIEEYLDGNFGPKLITTYTTKSHRTENGETVYFVEKRTFLEDDFGRPRPFGEREFLNIREDGVILDRVSDCFIAGTAISLCDGSTRPIETIKPGDVVLSYNSDGVLVPGKVTRTFYKDVEHILDVFGLRVTPGHVTLCGDGALEGQHVPIIDILRTDGALVRQDGGIIRATTGAEIGTEADQTVVVVAGEDRPDGFKETARRNLRAGTRVVLESGHDISVLDLIHAAGGTLSSSGLVRTKDGAERPFLWPFPGGLPNCEDYVLRRSERTLGEIYARPEWEGAGPRLPGPNRLI